MHKSRRILHIRADSFCRVLFGIVFSCVCFFSVNAADLKAALKADCERIVTAYKSKVADLNNQSSGGGGTASVQSISQSSSKSEAGSDADKSKSKSISKTEAWKDPRVDEAVDALREPCNKYCEKYSDEDGVTYSPGISTDDAYLCKLECSCYENGEMKHNFFYDISDCEPDDG